MNEFMTSIYHIDSEAVWNGLLTSAFAPLVLCGSDGGSIVSSLAEHTHKRSVARLPQTKWNFITSPWIERFERFPPRVSV